MSSSARSANMIMLESHEGERAVLLGAWRVIGSFGSAVLTRVIRSIRLLPGPYSVF